MKTHILRENKGRMGWSETHCGLVGWLDHHSHDEFITRHATAFRAIEEHELEPTMQLCLRCYRICL